MIKGLINNCVTTLILSGCLIGVSCRSSSSVSQVTSSELNAAVSKAEDFCLSQISDLQLELWSGEYDPYKKGTFDPSKKGYQRIDTSSGSFLVILEDVKPYADGFKLNFRIGNINYATYHDPELTIEWGRRLIQKEMKYVDWKKGLKSKTEKITKILRPGQWNPTSIIIAPATNEQIGHIALSLDIQSVSLTR